MANYEGRKGPVVTQTGVGVRGELAPPQLSPAATSATAAAQSPVLTNEEAVRYLRLDEDFNELGDAIRALHRLVQQRKLRPLRCGKSYKFTIPELERFTVVEVRASDQEADGNEG